MHARHEYDRPPPAVQAVSLHTVILGDKDSATKSQSPIISYNHTHAADMVEPRGGPGGCDRLFESKVVSPCTQDDRQLGKMTGRHVRKHGNEYAFGNTEESYRIMILGNKQRSVRGEPDFDPETGEGYVPQRDGDYAPARRAGRCVIPLISEVFGGQTPHAVRFLRELSQVAAKFAARDSTKYTRCARTFRTYHGQRISHSIVFADALNIDDAVRKFCKDGPRAKRTASTSAGRATP